MPLRISSAPEPGTDAEKVLRRTSDRTRVVPGRIGVGTVTGGPPSRGRYVRSTWIWESGPPGSSPRNAPRKTSLEKTAPFRPGAAATAGIVHSLALLPLRSGGLRKGSFVDAFEITVP